MLVYKVGATVIYTLLVLSLSACKTASVPTKLELPVECNQTDAGPEECDQNAHLRRLPIYPNGFPR